MYRHGMEVQVFQIIRQMILCLGRTSVLEGLLLQSLGRLPKTPCIISNGLRSFVVLHVEL